MPKYEYVGEGERVFPSLGITAKKGDVFEAPEGFKAMGVNLVGSNKTAPAVSQAVKDNHPTSFNKEKKEETKPSASSDQNAGA